MDALTVNNPYAHFICVGIKPIENRTWPVPIKRIGKRVLIHSSKNSAKGFLSSLLTEDQMKAVNQSSVITDKKAFVNGAIIGSAVISEMYINHPNIWAIKSYPNSHILTSPLIDKKQWHKLTYNWVLEKPILYDKPVFISGNQNFWKTGYDEIVCPSCKEVQLAKIQGEGWWYVHTCNKCGHIITESEWQIND
jgi:hypothetical protein